MGLIRMGDPYGSSDTDTMVVRGLVLHLDSVWRGDWEADNRAKQLEKDGKTVYVIPRGAPPEEVKSHYHTRGIPEIGEPNVHIDGRTTTVFDVWVIKKRIGKRRIKKTKTKPKLKRKTIQKKSHGYK